MNTPRPVLASLLITSLISPFGCASAPRFGHPSGTEAVEGLVAVGSGEAFGQPDIARVDLGVMIRAASVQDATQQSNATMRTILEAMRKQGLMDRDLRTQNLSVWEERTDVPPPEPMPSKAAVGRSAVPVTHYVAQNAIEITVRDLDKLGQVIGAAMQAGANQVQGVRLELDDPSKIRHEAREKAVADARKQAEQLAGLAGVRLGKVVSIRSGDVMGPHPMPVAYDAARMQEASAQSVPVERGELRVRQNVEMRFRVERLNNASVRGAYSLLVVCGDDPGAKVEGKCLCHFGRRSHIVDQRKRLPG